MNNGQGDMMSPLRVQPLKKQRSGATPSSQRPPATTPNTLAVEADEGIARRRAELRRLKEARSKYTGSKTPTSARPKVTSATERLTSDGRNTGPTARPTQTRIGRAPPPPPVNRKLEFNNKRKTPAPRAKSAPPRRPPPPPVRAKETPNEAPAKVNGFNKTGKTSPSRPAPIDPFRLMKDEAPKLEDEKPLPVKTPAPTKQQTSDSTIMEDKKTASKTPMPIGKVSNDASAAFKSPEVVLSTDPISPPSTVRRDRIQQFREGLDTPPQSPKWSKVEPNNVSTSEPVISVTNARLEETLKKSEEEKSELYKKIKELETKLVENMASTPLTPVKDMTSLQEVMDMAKEQGEEAALKWASQQLASREKTGGLLSPAIPSTPIGRRSVSQRTATPHPKRDLEREGTDNAISDEDLEKRFIGSFREAAAYVPYEYFGSSSISSNIGNDGSNQLCTFYVRRPYGAPPQSEIFDLVSPTPHDAYSRKAHVSDPTSIQIAVSIPYDESVLCLFGKAGVRYRITPTGNFESYPNIGQKVFGSISYIDDTANEQEYSLDQILEEALAVRDQYCSTMMTTALGFQQRKPQLAPAPAAAQTAEKASVAEIGVNTMPTEIEIGEGKDKKVESKPEKETSKPKKQKEVDPVDDDDSSGAADVLTIFLGMVAKSIFGFVWWIILGLPLAAIRTSLTFILATAVLGMLYLYALNDHFVSLQQSDEAFWYASHYHANHAPGLL